jgi:thiol-disulfide isomerase/thioredoxin
MFPDPFSVIEMKLSTLLAGVLCALLIQAGCTKPSGPQQSVASPKSSNPGESQAESPSQGEGGDPAKGSAEQETVQDEGLPVGEPTMTPEQQNEIATQVLQEINQEYDHAVEVLEAEIASLSDDAQKQQLFNEKNPEPVFTRKLLSLARKYPQTETAFSAVMSIVLERQTSQEFPQAMDFTLDHFGDRVQWHKIAEDYLELVPSQQIENWMRKMIATASDDETKVKMTYLLYRYFDQFPTFASTIEYNPELKKRFSDQQLEYISKRKEVIRPQLLKDLKVLKEKHPDIKAQNQKVVKDLIDGPIFELERLQVGSLAPDIEGEDFDGIKFNLSDYRGKVVMLDFWGQWCGPCRAMFPHQRQLIKQLVGKPFVLIGVNSDRRLETAVRTTNNENLVWRNFWCGPSGRMGPIAKKWNVSAWPTVYLIDAQGVIRYKEIFGPDIDQGIKRLLKEMGHEVSWSQRDAFGQGQPARLVLRQSKKLFNFRESVSPRNLDPVFPF